jgi:hypothetical protein
MFLSSQLGLILASPRPNAYKACILLRLPIDTIQFPSQFLNQSPFGFINALMG